MKFNPKQRFLFDADTGTQGGLWNGAKRMFNKYVGEPLKNYGKSMGEIADKQQEAFDAGAELDPVTGKPLTKAGYVIDTVQDQDGKTKFYTPQQGYQNDARVAINDIETTAKAKDLPSPDTDFDYDSELAALKERYKNIDDYYDNSMSGAWDNLSDRDKRILLLDQIGTTLRNASKYRAPMYSAYGKNYEGQSAGDEKSMLQNMLQSSLKAGLERRNSRLDNQLEEQLQLAKFPADFKMQMETLLGSGRVDNKLKMEMLEIMKNVGWVDAWKMGMIQRLVQGSGPFQGGLGVTFGPKGFTIGN